MLVFALGCGSVALVVEDGGSETASPTGDSADRVADSGGAGADSASALDPSDSADSADPADSGPTTDTGEPDLRPFTIAVLPDTQNYAASYPDIYTEQTAWLVANADDLNLVMVLHEGDITDDNGDEQWAHAQASMSLLDGVVPYVMALGNHDLGSGGSGSDRTTGWDTWFPEAAMEQMDGYGGHMKGREAAYYATFRAGGQDYLAMALEFGPNPDHLAWANEVVAAHPDHRVMITTHCYLSPDEELVGPSSGYSPDNYGVSSDGAANGETMWLELVSLHDNIFLIVNGHLLGDGAGQLISLGLHDNPIVQLMANYQNLDHGGEGWMRLMTFRPADDLIDVTTYSPWLDALGESPWNLDEQHTFTLSYDL